MRLEKLQDYLHRRGWEYQYTEEAGCGSIDWEYRGLMYHVWEFSKDSAESNGVKLLLLDTVETAGGGCVCPENAILRRIINNLVLHREDAVILDMETGLEHFVPASIPEEEFWGCGESIGKPIYYVWNKVTEENKAFMMDTIADRNTVAERARKKRRMTPLLKFTALLKICSA